MHLQKFRVSHFRNIHDSGWVDLAHTTALVGRNECGKTNLLTALLALAHEGGEAPFSRARDFPADRMRSEYAGDLCVVRTRWSLTPEERGQLAAILHRDEAPPVVDIEQPYEGPPIVHFGDGQTGSPREIASGGEPWDAAPESAGGLHPPSESLDTTDPSAAAQWVLDRLPCFLFADQAPEVDGRMDLRAFARRREEGIPGEGDTAFALLLQIAGIGEPELQEILSGDVEARRQLVSQAGAAVTRAIREMWTDRPLKVRFHLDGDQLNTLVCDPTAFADVELNLDQRSQGFRWFFSFFVILKASQLSADDRGMLLLLDEPGRHLHPVGQLDLIRFLCALDAPSLLTTQSPAFLPSGTGSSILAVHHDPEAGTSVSAGPVDLPGMTHGPAEPTAATPAPAEASEPEETPVAAGDPGRLTLEDAGARMVAGLVGDGPALLVENLADFWYLQTISEYLERRDRLGLPEGIAIVPAGGAAYLGLLASVARQGQDAPIVVVGSRPEDEVHAALGDFASEAKAAYIFAGSVHEAGKTGRCEIEDLIEATTYERFVRVAFANVLKDERPEFDASIPNHVARCEQAFEALGHPFSRDRLARLIANGSERNLRTLLSGGAEERFVALLDRIRDAFDPQSDEGEDAGGVEIDSAAS